MDELKAAYPRRSDHGARVLVVDDDAVTRRTLRALLERSAYEVETAAGGAEAIAAVPVWRPDLVLLDILMPGMDGLETCRRLRAMPGGDLLPIVFLTADERPEVHAEAFRVKGDDLLRKPVLASELVVRIRSLMRLKRLQSEVHAERDALIEAQRQREQLFEFIVHDLKAPLATVTLGLDLIREGGTQLATLQPQVQRIRDTVQAMDRMIQNILDLGRAEHLGLEVRHAPIALDQWLPALLAELEGRAGRLGQRLSWECPPNLSLYADPDLLGRVLLNLLDNAMKYADAGGRLQVEAEETGEGVLLRVRDEGQGVPAGMRQTIFDRFVRLEAGQSPAKPGTGLGLAFCQTAVEAHGGRIWVEDNAPHGSVFVIDLPRWDPSQVPAIRASALGG